MDLSKMTASALAAEAPELAEALRLEGEQRARAAIMPPTAASIAADHAAVADALRAEGAGAERARVAALEAAALPGFEDLLAAHKADGAKTDVDLMRAQTEAQKQQGATSLATAQIEDDKLAGRLPPPGAVDPGAPGPDAPKAAAPQYGEPQDAAAEERDKAMFAADANLRAEFGGNEKAYLRYCADVREGRIRRYQGAPAAA